MRNDTQTGSRSSVRVVLWIVVCYISAMAMILLACVLSTPIAWLSAALNLSEREFLVLSAIPVLVSVYVIQHWRVGERTLEIALVRVSKQKVDISQTRQVHAIWRIWHDIQRLSKDRIANWTNLCDFANLAKERIFSFQRTISDREKVIRQLVRWAAAPGIAPILVAELYQALERCDELQRRAVSLGNEIVGYNEKIVEGAKSLLWEAGRFRRQEIELKKLRSTLESAEEVLRVTLWTWIESRSRRAWLSAYDHSYNRQRECVAEWLEAPFDPTSPLMTQGAMLKPLGGKTIQCRDRPLEIRLKAGGPGPLTPTTLSSEAIRQLRDL